MILLDSDILVDVLRHFPPALNWLAGAGATTVAIAGYSAMELCAGVRNAGEQQKVDGLLSNLQTLWPESSSCDAALETYRALHLAHGLSILDAPIAHTALERNVPLHTFNVKHYAPIANLKTIQPYTR